MKRWIALLLSLALTATLSGCSQAAEDAMTSIPTNPTAAPLDIAVPDIASCSQSTESIVYVQNASGEWSEMLRLPGGAKRAALADIPAITQQAVIAAIDPKFYDHNGTYGATATITKRVLSLIGVDAAGETLDRLATQTEKERYSKEQLLEAYLNLIPFADNVIGVREAAYYYYGVNDLQAITIAQSSMLAVIATDPIANDPFTAPDAAKAARADLLKELEALGHITAYECSAASAAALPTAPVTQGAPVWDYYVDLLIEDVIDDLCATHGYSYDEAETIVFRGGLKIYSYEDPQKQAIVEEIFCDDSMFPGSGINSTMFIMDYEGRVVATAGGRGEKTANRIKNRSTDVRRQPGSTVKPIAVYAPALEEDIINYSTFVRDAPILLDAYTLWPPNYQQKPKDDGWASVKYALQQSLNTVPVRILMQLGVTESYNFLRDKLHVTSPQEIDKNLGALALGGFVEGVTAREMAAAYQVFGNSGVYNSPHTYHKVEQNGTVLLEHVLEKEQAISPETATIMNKMLQNVVNLGTGSAIAHQWPDTAVFAKTGTTDAYRDSYFVGGTPYYVASLWMGYDSGASMTPDQCAYQKLLWSRCMKALHENLPDAEFPIWGDVVSRYYDPGSGCVTDGSYGNLGWYKTSNIPYSNNMIPATIYTALTTAGTATTTTVATTTQTDATAATTADTETTATTATTAVETTTATVPEETTTATEPPTETTVPPDVPSE